jgi:hypothetical protein
MATSGVILTDDSPLARYLAESQIAADTISIPRQSERERERDNRHEHENKHAQGLGTTKSTSSFTVMITKWMDVICPLLSLIAPSWSSHHPVNGIETMMKRWATVLHDDINNNNDNNNDNNDDTSSQTIAEQRISNGIEGWDQPLNPSDSDDSDNDDNNTNVNKSVNNDVSSAASQATKQEVDSKSTNKDTKDVLEQYQQSVSITSGFCIIILPVILLVLYIVIPSIWLFATMSFGLLVASLLNAHLALVCPHTKNCAHISSSWISIVDVMYSGD